MKHPVTAPPRKRDIILSNVEDLMEKAEWLRALVKLEVPFWRSLFGAYEKSSASGGKVLAPNIRQMWADPNIRELVAHAASIRHFEPCWAQDRRTSSRFVKKKLVNEPESTLFEIWIAMQYCFARYQVGLLPEFPGVETTPDIVVRHPERNILVECKIKRPDPVRKKEVDKLIYDLTEGGIYDKMRKQIRDWGLPLILVIKVPEEINWADQALREEPDERIGRSVYSDRSWDYKLINFVIFVSGLNPSERINQEGEFQPDNLTFAFFNKHAKYDIPPDFRVHGAR